MKRKNWVIILCSVVGILAIPLVAMQFTEEVNWGIADFTVAFLLLLTAGLSADWVWQKVQTKKLKILLLFAIGIALVLFWAELAVGIFGTPLAGS